MTGRRPGVGWWRAVGLIVVVGFAGCGQGSGGPSSAASAGSAVPSSATTVLSTATTGARPASPRSTKPAGGRVVPGGGRREALLVVPDCDPAGVEVSLDVQPRSGSQAADWSRALIVVTAVSAEPCRLDGYTEVKAVEGTTINPVEVQWIAGERRSDAVTVRAGASGFAAIGWQSQPGCPQVSGIDVILPGDRHRAKVELVGAVGTSHAVTLCASTAELGPFVASAAIANAEDFMAPSG